MGGQQVTYHKGPFAGLVVLAFVLVPVVISLPGTVSSGSMPGWSGYGLGGLIVVLATIYGVLPMAGGISIDDGFMVIDVGPLMTAAIPLDTIGSIDLSDDGALEGSRLGVRVDGRTRTASIITGSSGLVTVRMMRPIPIKAGPFPKRIETLRITLADPDLLAEMLGEEGIEIAGQVGDDPTERET